jgi:hypothetical protein
LSQASFYRAVPVTATATRESVSLHSPVTGEWIDLRGTARQIWERLEYSGSVDDVAAALGAEYNAPLRVIRQSVSEIVDGLVRLGLLERVAEASSDPMRDRYLSLLKRALANMLYPELELQIQHLERGADGLSGLELERFQRDIAQRQAVDFVKLLEGKQQGTGPHRFPHTMIGLFRLRNIERCAEQVLAEGIPGDFLEAGVCKGGATIFMRALQIAHGAAERKTFVVDSFTGLPPSDQARDKTYGLELDETRFPSLACGESAVRDHFSRYGLLDRNVEFVSGWLAESLPAAPIGPLALLRIDVDLYSSTLDCLDLLYDKVVDGGFVIVDDYLALKPCRDAVDEFRERRGLPEPIRWIDRSGIYWRKGAP